MNSFRVAMLMLDLVRTLIQHEVEDSRVPFLMSNQILASQEQDYRSLPHSQPGLGKEIFLLKS